MLNFFKRIRQRLINNGNLKRYLIYAIGEILLVMIGILLALQVNNWNESLKTGRLEQTYLKQLKEEFNYNREELDEVMRINKKFADRALEISKHTGPDKPQLSEKEFVSLLVGATNLEVQYRPSNGVLDEIINSGKLGIFSNQSLRTSLSSWNSILYKIRFQEQEMAKFRNGLVDLLGTKGNSRKAFFDTYGTVFEMTPSKFKESNLSLLNSVEFDNQLFGFLATSRYANQNYYPNLKTEIDKILQLIDDQLVLE